MEGLDDATVDILLKIREQGMEAFNQASLFARNLKEAIESVNRATAEGVAPTDAMRSAMGSLTRGAVEAGLSLKEVKSVVTDVRQATMKYFEVVAAGMAPEAAFVAVLQATTVEMNRNTEAAKDNRHAYELLVPAVAAAAVSIKAASGAMLGGINPFNNWLTFILDATAALAPFVIAGTAATVMVTAFSFGLLGMMAATGGAALFFGGLAAAAFMLADATGKLDVTVGGRAGGGASTAQINSLADAQRALSNFNALHTGTLTLAQQQQQQGLGIRESRAQAAVDAANAGAGIMSGGQSVNQLSQNFKDLAASIGERAVPAARELIAWINGGFGTIKSLADAILSWFSDRLPLVLNRVGVMLRDMLPSFRDFAKFLGAAFDHMSPQIGPMFELLTRFALGFGQGLISNLMALSDWFQDRLPTYGPIISQIFGGIGSAVQGVATAFGHLSDWFAAHWSDIKSQAQGFSDAFGKAFGAFNIQINGSANLDATGAVNGLATALGAVASVAWDLIRVLAILVTQAIAALPAALANIGDSFYENVEAPILGGLNNIIEAINSLPAPIKAVLGISGNVPLFDLSVPGQGGGANPGAGRTGGGQTSPGGASTRTAGHQITIHVNGATSPQVTANTIARNLRKVGVV